MGNRNIGNGICRPLEVIGLIISVEVQKICRHFITVVQGLNPDLRLLCRLITDIFLPIIVDFGTFFRKQGRMDLLLDLFRWRSFLGYVIGAHLDIIDEYISVVDGGWELIRKLHLAVDDEFDMVSPRWEFEDCGENIGVVTMRNQRLAALLNAILQYKCTISSHPEHETSREDDRDVLMVEHAVIASNLRVLAYPTTQIPNAREKFLTGKTHSRCMRYFLLHEAKVPVM